VSKQGNSSNFWNRLRNDREIVPEVIPEIGTNSLFFWFDNQGPLTLTLPGMYTGAEAVSFFPDEVGNHSWVMETPRKGGLSS